MKKYYNIIAVVILTAILLLALFKGCEKDKEIDRLKSNTEALQDTIKYKDNAIGTITASKSALEVTQKELEQQIWIKDEKLAALQKDFKSLSSTTKIDQEVIIKEIPVPYKDSIQCIFERSESVAENWYSLDIYSDQKGITLSNIKIPNEQYIITGYKGGGFFGTGSLTVDVANTNPLIHTTNIQTQVVKIEQPFYNKGWFRVAEVVTSFCLGVAAAK